jgi:hypothetical protein
MKGVYHQNDQTINANRDKIDNSRRHIVRTSPLNPLFHIDPALKNDNSKLKENQVCSGKLHSPSKCLDVCLTEAETENSENFT